MTICKTVFILNFTTKICNFLKLEHTPWFEFFLLHKSGSALPLLSDSFFSLFVVMHHASSTNTKSMNRWNRESTINLFMGWHCFYKNIRNNNSRIFIVFTMKVPYFHDNITSNKYCTHNLVLKKLIKVLKFFWTLMNPHIAIYFVERYSNFSILSLIVRSTKLYKCC